MKVINWTKNAIFLASELFFYLVKSSKPVRCAIGLVVVEDNKIKKRFYRTSLNEQD